MPPQAKRTPARSPLLGQCKGRGANGTTCTVLGLGEAQYCEACLRQKRQLSAASQQERRADKRADATSFAAGALELVGVAAKRAGAAHAEVEPGAGAVMLRTKWSEHRFKTWQFFRTLLVSWQGRMPGDDRDQPKLWSDVARRARLFGRPSASLAHRRSPSAQAVSMYRMIRSSKGVIKDWAGRA